MRQTLATALHQALRDGGTDFTHDQLAYLAATRKIEDPVRDAVAWRLHQTLLCRGLTVSREFPIKQSPDQSKGTWARADIAILESASVVAVVELKALHTFDVHKPKKREEYRGRVAADLKRVAMHVPGADAFAVALTTHVAGNIRPDLPDVVKYARVVRSATKKYGDADALRNDALPLWREAMTRLEAPIDQLELGRGEVWGLEVIVDAWLVDPVPRSELARTS